MSGMMTEPYDLLIEAAAHTERKQLPGQVRQLVKQAIAALRYEPRPHISETLDTTGLDIPPDVELRRIRLDQWGIIYAVNDVEQWTWVWGVRKRPPYDYQDLTEFVARL